MTPSSLPYQHFTSPFDKWAVQPSFVLGEYLFILCAAVALYHACKSSRQHLLVWVGALIAGTANDVIFMALPLVDNFWQAQATVMITARLPLYIPCVYVCFMYYPTVSVWRLGLPPLGRAALTGLAAIAFYAPYDVVGAKFLWWTWHDTDRPILHRVLGAPIGSTVWVITFVAAFSYLINHALDRDSTVKARTALRGLAMVAGLSTIIMVLQMTVLQQLDGGIPGIRGLIVVVLLYATLVAFGWRRRASDAATWPRLDKLLHAMTVLYFTTLVVIMGVFKPEAHVSLSVHQTYGPCHVEAKDITGTVRYEYICIEDFDEDFTFDLGNLPDDKSRWYAVTGRAHTNYAQWLGGVSAMGLIGALLYTLLLRAPRNTLSCPGRSRHSSRPSRATGTAKRS